LHPGIFTGDEDAIAGVHQSSDGAQSVDRKIVPVIEVERMPSRLKIKDEELRSYLCNFCQVEPLNHYNTKIIDYYIQACFLLRT
jgi:hypothetical protein